MSFDINFRYTQSNETMVIIKTLKENTEILIFFLPALFVPKYA